ncbi:hypothetical protein BT96DRAFT_1014773 [Gymnopus androsaceus JB14]|uniref:Rhodopsin domain-containing protein n=1 Tax=Gymnopus androsaceus JB14 TaxID=1447944 RepID=A0A6A4ICQ9_9AGAR|nr:hypothetical protein BT96DRAFT_1014773 [Gymnopus androsaceus JB14]
MAYVARPPGVLVQWKGKLVVQEKGLGSTYPIPTSEASHLTQRFHEIAMNIWIKSSNVTTPETEIQQILMLVEVPVEPEYGFDIANSVYGAILTVILSIVEDISLLWQGPNPLIPSSPHTQVVQFWLGMICFTVAIWCARMSLICSIIRLVPPLFTLRRISEWTAVLFSFICVGVLTPKIYVCASDQSWYDMPHPICNVGPEIGIPIGDFITDLVADITLVVIPIRLLGFVNLPQDKRRMLIVIFGASVFTSAMSVVHSVLLIMMGAVSSKFDFIVPIAAEAELGTALIVANLGVLTPYIYRLIGKRDGDIDSKPYTHYPSIQTNGDIRMRRVSDLLVSGVRLTDTGRVSTSVRVQEPEPPKIKLEDPVVLGLSLSSDSNASPSDGTDSYNIPKSGHQLQDNLM